MYVKLFYKDKIVFCLREEDIGVTFSQYSTDLFYHPSNRESIDFVKKFLTQGKNYGLKVQNFDQGMRVNLDAKFGVFLIADTHLSIPKTSNPLAEEGENTITIPASLCPLITSYLDQKDMVSLKSADTKFNKTIVAIDLKDLVSGRVCSTDHKKKFIAEFKLSKEQSAYTMILTEVFTEDSLSYASTEAESEDELVDIMGLINLSVE
jgi:hypothetical protein